MFQIVIDWVSRVILFFSYPGIAFLMVLESMVFPLPSEAVLPFAGYLVSLGRMNLLAVAAWATAGSLIGSWISYEIGSRGGRPFLRKYGKYFLMNETHLLWTEQWFTRYGDKTIFFSRLLPVVRHFISIPAGMSGMGRTKFFFYTATGAFLWNLFLTSIGVLLGSEWERIQTYTQPFEVVILIIIVFLAAWFVFKQIEKRTLKTRRRFWKRSKG